MYYELLIQWLHEQWNLPHILPQTPSKASTSIIKCPLPIPPNDGLQDISPIKKINTFLSSWWIHLVLSKLNKLCLIHHAFRHSKGFTANFSMFSVSAIILRQNQLIKIPVIVQSGLCYCTKSFHIIAKTHKTCSITTITQLYYR